MLEAKEAKKITTENMSKQYYEDFVTLGKQAERLIEAEASFGKFQVCFCAGICDCEAYQAFKNKAAMKEVAKMLKSLGYKVKMKKDATKAFVYYYIDISWKEPIKNAARTVLGTV